ncbi:MAG: STAS/SEC14 domain-containing protein [Gammaproteobacteria bacterium]|nr:STAS/SEC14 domain-containing protein [Gammaproteobacteria bacterium]
MLVVNLNEIEGIALLEPDGELSENDFKSVAAVVDPYIEKTGKLNGIIIRVRTFPGWDSFAALIKHLEFIREHHKKVSHVAFVTDSPIAGFAEHIASHFVNAEIKGFSFGELEASKKWILGGAHE